MCKKSKFAYHAFALVLCEILIATARATTVNRPNTVSCEEKLIIDTDAGSDDGVAILLLLEEQKQLNRCTFEVIAITCSYGNTNLEQVETNVRKTLTIANRPEIPVYPGASKSILRKPGHTSSFGFGNDGFGDYNFEDEILGEVDHSKHASLAMIELTKAHPGEINILVLGPMTNVALATRLDDGFVDRIKHLYVMGSSIAGVGNISPGLEFNFEADPEANYIMLNSFSSSSKLTLFPWETGIRSGFEKMKDWREVAFKGHDSKLIRFLDGIESVALKLPSYSPVDVFIAAAMIMGDKIITETLETEVKAVVEGEARGGVLVDYKHSLKKSNAKIILAMNVEEYKKLFVCVFAGVCNSVE